LTNLANDVVAEMILFSEGVVLAGSGTPITSRSHCAKDKSTLSVSLPVLEVVVKDGSPTRTAPRARRTARRARRSRL
jgi:hypothetical protein